MGWMARMAISTAALLGLGGLVDAVNAAEWFVDASGSAPCSDSVSAGSERQPWCKINYAIARSRPGDIVYVKNGTYREDVYIAGKNGGANYITFQNYPGHFPVIRGNGVASGRNKIIDSGFVKFIGFTITEFQQGLFVEKSNNILLQDLKVYNVGQEAVHIKLNSSLVTLKDSVIYDTGKWQYNGEGVYIGTSSSQQPNSPPYDNTHDITVKGNTIYNTKDECIEAKEGTYSITIDSNKMYDCLLDPKITSPSWGAIEVMEHDKYYNSNPNHVIKNNVIFMTKTGIGVHTGATVFNNVIYGQTGSFRGISIDRADSDNYPRRVYHNTIDLPDFRAVVSSRGGSVDIRNNIGPSSPSNMASHSAFFVNRAGADYRLAPGSAPIDAGVNLIATVPQDIEGGSRSNNPAPDLGAFEFGAHENGGSSLGRR